MAWRSTMILSAGLFLAACGADGEASAGAGDNSAEPAANAATSAVNTAEAETAAPATAAPGYTLAGNGLLPGLTFGTPRDQAVEAAQAAFGMPTAPQHNDECGEGPMDFVGFGDLQLSFQEGRLAGWSVGGRQPALRTAGGLFVGAPRSALGDAEIDQESTLGPEFFIDDVGGILDETGARIEALWAGAVCQFR